jgi:hypothetical protein
VGAGFGRFTSDTLPMYVRDVGSVLISFSLDRRGHGRQSMTTRVAFCIAIMGAASIFSSLPAAGAPISIQLFNSTEIAYDADGLFAEWLLGEPAVDLSGLGLGDDWIASLVLRASFESKELFTPPGGTPMSRYSFDHATLDMHLEQTVPGGIGGDITAQLSTFSFDVDEVPDAEGFRGAGFFDLEIVGGTIDAQLAQALGVKRHVRGSGTIGMDTPEGFFDDDEHAARAEGSIVLTPVPEPGAMLLLGIGIATSLRRRSKRSA